MAVSSSGAEDCLSVVCLIEVALHLAHGSILAGLDDLGIIGGVRHSRLSFFAYEGVEDLLVDRGVVVFEVYEVIHRV